MERKYWESFSAGDVLYEVKTDKATVSFDAQDDSIIAKIIAVVGPTEIDCGVPILITVDDESDIDGWCYPNVWFCWYEICLMIQEASSF